MGIGGFYLPGSWKGELFGSEMGKEVLSGLKCSCNVGLSMGLSICCRGTRTGGRTEKKKLILQFSHIHVQNVAQGLWGLCRSLKDRARDLWEL